MDLSFILSDICISWILLHTPFHINCLLFLFSYDFIFRWMQINAKCSFKYALVFYPAPPPHIEGGNFQWASDHVCSLGLDPSSPATGALPFSSSSRRLALCTTLQRGFDVARLEKDAVPFDEMRLACSQSMCVDLQNTGVHSNQCWREIIYCNARVKRSASYWLELKKDELLISLRIWRRKLLSLIVFPQCWARQTDIFKEATQVPGENQWRAPVTA